MRVSRIHRSASRHEFIDLTLTIALDGDFNAAYTEADNSMVVATDSMKNTVYVLASRHGILSIESFTQLLGDHFLKTYSHVNRVDIQGQEKVWARMQFGGKPHDHAFMMAGANERYTCHFMKYREMGFPFLHSGLTDLQVLKTTGSGFSGFLRDEYTTLPETNDRIFATSISATWPCSDLTSDWSAARHVIRAALLDVFAKHFSKSVQHTLYEMAGAAFAACSLIDEITIAMPNQHHLPANLAPFGLQNPNEVFVPTSEPFGIISATIARGQSEKKP